MQKNWNFELSRLSNLTKLMKKIAQMRFVRVSMGEKKTCQININHNNVNRNNNSTMQQANFAIERDEWCWREFAFPFLRGHICSSRFQNAPV